jgi:hypothetical protein
VNGLDQAKMAALLVGVAVLLVLLVVPKIAPQVPAVLVAVVGATIASAAFGLSADGVATVGALPRGVPSPIASLDERQRRRTAAGRRGWDHARLAHRHDRDGFELRGTARR